MDQSNKDFLDIVFSIEAYCQKQSVPSSILYSVREIKGYTPKIITHDNLSLLVAAIGNYLQIHKDTLQNDSVLLDRVMALKEYVSTLENPSCARRELMMSLYGFRPHSFTDETLIVQQKKAESVTGATHNLVVPDIKSLLSSDRNLSEHFYAVTVIDPLYFWSAGLEWVCSASGNIEKDIYNAMIINNALIMIAEHGAGYGYYYAQARLREGSNFLEQFNKAKNNVADRAILHAQMASFVALTYLTELGISPLDLIVEPSTIGVDVAHFGIVYADCRVPDPDYGGRFELRRRALDL